MNRLSNIPATTAALTPALLAATLAAVTLLALPGCNRRSSLTGTGDAVDTATAGDDATASDTATSGTEPSTSDTDATTASDDGDTSMDDGDTSMDDGGDSTGDDCEGILGCPDGAPFPEACSQYGLFDLERGASPAFGACDFWAQDCEDGQKCLDVQCSNGTYDGSGAWCVPVGSAPLKAPCTLVADGRDGGYGEDTCGADGICLEAAVFSQSTCVELCTGTPALPSCPATGSEGKRCVQLRGGSLNICVAECSPFQANSCPDGWSCMPATEGEVLTTMMCYPNPSPGSGPGGGPAADRWARGPLRRCGRGRQRVRPRPHVRAGRSL